MPIVPFRKRPCEDDGHEVMDCTTCIDDQTDALVILEIKHILHTSMLTKLAYSSRVHIFRPVSFWATSGRIIAQHVKCKRIEIALPCRVLEELSEISVEKL